MTVPVSEQQVSMLAVFMVVSLAAERVVQVLKNGLRTLAQKKTADSKDKRGLQAQAPPTPWRPRVTGPCFGRGPWLWWTGSA